MRIITVSRPGKVTAGVLQLWPAISITSMFTRDAPAFPASEVPPGGFSREPSGREALLTVDGFRLELDGQGKASVYEGTSQVPAPGIFMVVEVLPE